MKKILKTFLLFIIFACVLVGCSNNHNNKNTNMKHKEEIPVSYQDNGIFKNYYKKAYKKLQGMTTEEKVGQILFARMPQVGIIDDITKYNLGGFIMFGVDFKNKTEEDIIDSIKEYQKVSKIPLLLGVDEEGGIVVRISSNPNLYKERFKSPQDIYNASGMEGIIKDTEEKAALLKKLGLNVNLAPVVDVSTNPDDYIYDRSLGRDANTTKEYVENVVDTYNKNNIGSTLKHFPGYGNNKDTHTGIAIDERPIEEFNNNDFLPFKGGIEKGAPSILVSHNIVKCMDEIPASLSKNVHDILRNDLKFTGIIMTDDLDMDALDNYTSTKDVDAFKAGNDLLITTEYAKSYNNILNAINDKTLKMEDLNHKVFRVLAWKYQLGLLK